MPYPGYTTDEIGRLGQALYERQIRNQVETDHRGEFLVVDITTGAYEVDHDDLTASNRALAKNPDAILYGLRVGFPAAYRIGAASTQAIPKVSHSS